MTASSRLQRRLAAILAADVVGYSRLVAADEAGTLAALRQVWTERFDPVVAAHRGRIVKTMGDGALVEFASAVDAVEAALAVQAAMTERNTTCPPEAAIEFRIGINLGDIVAEGDDILGDGVNIAARLEAQAPRGGVLVADAVHAQVRGKIAADFTDAGLLELKNMTRPVRAWAWTPDGTAVAVQAPTATPPRDLPSIAVLPFANLSGDPEQDHFADGLVEDIVTALSKLAGLRVVARNSTQAFRGSSLDLAAIARQLGVRHVLQGSVRRAGARLRISAQLVDVATGSPLWAERYDRPVGDLFAVQDEITLVLATEMQVMLTEGEQARLRYRATSNVEAWTLWIKGLTAYRRAVTRENCTMALQAWQQALALDPGSGTLRAMIGLMHYLAARFDWCDDRTATLARARCLVDEARALEPDNADASWAASLVALAQGDDEIAAAAARHAVRLAPGAADAATFACFVLANVGFPEEAIREGERALALSPAAPGFYLGHLGHALRLAGRLDAAEAAFREYLARSPGFGLVDLVLVHVAAGRADRARDTARQLLAARPDFTIADWRRSQYRADPAGLAADLAALASAGLPAG
ncbi:MAG: adenylate/guanylate cyclase domain-containing protein [Geminicoccaceae bacterium]